MIGTRKSALFLSSRTPARTDAMEGYELKVLAGPSTSSLTDLRINADSEPLRVRSACFDGAHRPDWERRDPDASLRPGQVTVRSVSRLEMRVGVLISTQQHQELQGPTRA